ncbi:hypothetical protein IFR05_006683 [Cadophora sp. M221]|nr:hypothetical protein IFR05_006683 [Cadophora sp. M221]
MTAPKGAGRFRIPTSFSVPCKQILTVSRSNCGKLRQLYWQAKANQGIEDDRIKKAVTTVTTNKDKEIGDLKTQLEKLRYEEAMSDMKIKTQLLKENGIMENTGNGSLAYPGVGDVEEDIYNA